MNANFVLTNIALLLLAWVLYDDMKRGDRLDPRHRTWLLTAGIFAVASILATFFR